MYLSADSISQQILVYSHNDKISVESQVHILHCSDRDHSHTETKKSQMKEFEVKKRKMRKIQEIAKVNVFSP